MTYWTEKDDEIVKTMRREGATNEQISQKLGRTVPAVANRVYFLRRTGEMPPTHWSEQETQRLWALPKLLSSSYKLFPGRTRAAIRRRWSLRPHPPSTAHTWTYPERQEVVRLVESGLTQAQVAEKMGVTRPSIHRVLQEQRKLGKAPPSRSYTPQEVELLRNATEPPTELGGRNPRAIHRKWLRLRGSE